MTGLACPEGCHRPPRRWWTYPRGSWEGRWIALGNDEYHCRDLVIALPGLRPLVIQLWPFNPAKCEDAECAHCWFAPAVGAE